MATAKQKLGEFGEDKVVKKCACPKCKKLKTLKRLPTNFKCADIICDFCGFLAQVKTSDNNRIDEIPKTILGAAWKPQKERMDSAIYLPLDIVLKNGRDCSIYYLSADLQDPGMFVPRKPLSSKAKRAGWQGFLYDMSKVNQYAIVRIY